MAFTQLSEERANRGEAQIASQNRESAFPLRHLLAVGAGIGLEIDGPDLLVTAVRVRFRRVTVLGELRIPDFATRPVSNWAVDYSAFVKRLDLSHMAVSVILPRESVTVRLLSLPPIGKKEMAAAVGYQLDALHPYPEEEACHSWAPLARGNDVLVAITNREALGRFITIFAEAGIQVASFVVAASALYTAVRYFAPPARQEFAAMEIGAGGVELYGESASRAVYSTFIEGHLAGSSRIAALARAELRLPPDVEILTLRDLLPAPTVPAGGELGPHPAFASPRSYAAALAAACPWLAVNLNLLPKEDRSSNSRLIYVPTAVLAVLLLAGALALALQNSWQQREYLKQLNAQIAGLESQAVLSRSLDHKTEIAVRQTKQIDSFRRRSKADLDALNEATRLLAPPTYLTSMDLTRTSAVFAGQTPSTQGMLKTLDASPQFKGSSFMMGIGRNGEGELFRIHANRPQVNP